VCSPGKRENDFKKRKKGLPTTMARVKPRPVPKKRSQKNFAARKDKKVP